MYGSSLHRPLTVTSLSGMLRQTYARQHAGISEKIYEHTHQQVQDRSVDNLPVQACREDEGFAHIYVLSPTAPCRTTSTCGGFRALRSVSARVMGGGHIMQGDHLQVKHVMQAQTLDINPSASECC